MTFSSVAVVLLPQFIHTHSQPISHIGSRLCRSRLYQRSVSEVHFDAASDKKAIRILKIKYNVERYESHLILSSFRFPCDTHTHPYARMYTFIRSRKHRNSYNIRRHTGKHEHCSTFGITVACSYCRPTYENVHVCLYAETSSDVMTSYTISYFPSIVSQHVVIRYMSFSSAYFWLVKRVHILYK